MHEYAEEEDSRDEPSVTSEVLDDALAEQMRLHKLLERQQRILKASKLMPDLAACSGNRKQGGAASEALIEDILNLTVFKQFLINQEHVALQKHIAHMCAEESIMESDYVAIW